MKKNQQERKIMNKKECKACGGMGDQGFPNTKAYLKCEKCKGTGYIYDNEEEQP